MDMTCFRCGKPYSDPGGLLFSPPDHNGDVAQVEKYHLCPICFFQLRNELDRYNSIVPVKWVDEDGSAFLSPPS